MRACANCFYQLVIGAGVVCAVAAAGGGFAQKAAAAAPSIAIGLMSEATGPYAENGENCQRGWRAARDAFAPGDRVGMHTVRFVFADSQGEAKTGVNEFRHLTENEHAQAVLTTRSQVGMAVNPLSRKAKIPLLGTVGHPDFVRDNEYAFRFYPTVKAESAALVEKAHELKLRRFALITAEDQWMLALSDAFSQQLRESGGEVVGSWSILDSDANIASTIMRIKQASADAVFVNLGISQSGVVFKKLYELGVGQPLFTQFWGASKEAREAAGAAAMEGVIFVEADLRKPKFLKLLRNAYGDERASAVTFSCYAALSTLLFTLKQNKEIDSTESLHAQLLKMREVELPDGTLMLRDREAQYDLMWKTVSRGEIIELPRIAAKMGKGKTN